MWASSCCIFWCFDDVVMFLLLSGPNVAKYSGEGLHKRIIADPAFAQGYYGSAIKNGFLEMDRALQHGMGLSQVDLHSAWITL